MNTVQILTPDEIGQVLGYLYGKKNRAGRAPTHLLDLAIFRLSCCCGLRRKEASLIQLRDMELVGPRPVIRIRPPVTKANKAGLRRPRVVPLWWDRGTRDDLTKWREVRLDMGAGPTDTFVCSLRRDYYGRPLTTSSIARQWDGLLTRVLGRDRAEQVSIHGGRHSFCSHALHGGRSLMEVRDAAGHTNISTTNIYVHAMETDCPDLFAIGEDDGD